MRRVEVQAADRGATVEVYVAGRRTFLGRTTTLEKARVEARRLADGGPVVDHTRRVGPDRYARAVEAVRRMAKR